MTAPSRLEALFGSARPFALGRAAVGLSDIALLLRQDGIVLDVPHVGPVVEPLKPQAWLGRPFEATLADESRAAAGALIEGLLRGQDMTGPPVLHPLSGKDVTAVLYAGVRLEGQRDIILLGRAMEPGAADDRIQAYIRLFSTDRAEADGVSAEAIAALARHAPDMVAMIDGDGRLIWANDAFHRQAETSLVAGIDGRFLEDIVVAGEEGALDGAIADAGREGIAEMGPASLIRDGGGALAVRLTVVRLPDTSPALYEVVIRGAETGGRGLRPAIDEMLERGSPVQLKGMVRETADIVERQCIVAALRLTSNNRSAAARTLGISRQALYQKLERFGLLDL